MLVALPASCFWPYVHNVTLRTLAALDAGDHGELDVVLLLNRRAYTKHDDIATKYNRARALALAGGYDGLLCVEADMIVPPDAARRLAAHDVGVAYGLYCMRHGERPWSAVLELRETFCSPISLYPRLARRLWGQTIAVAGVGQGCTWIRRDVLERVPFRMGAWGWFAPDWYFAYDCQELGIRQVCDLGVVCGHVDPPWVIWPDPAADSLHRLDRFAIMREGESWLMPPLPS